MTSTDGACETAKFWSRVARGEDCWTWTGSKTTGGYGNLRWRGGYEYAHRLAYKLAVGPIPEGLHLDHLCRNRSCCNPEHLEPVTQAENTRRGLASYEIRRTCKHGHDISDPGNVYTNPNGHRHCRVCAAAAEAARRKPDFPPSSCPSGHEFTPENTARSADGHRRCKECNRARARANHLKKRTSTNA